MRACVCACACGCALFLVAPDDCSVQADDLNDVELPPLPEEEPELIGTPKAPKIQLSHDAPLHANRCTMLLLPTKCLCNNLNSSLPQCICVTLCSQSLLKSLRGWLFGDDSDDNSKANGDTAFASNTLRNRDAVLAHAFRAEGWKNAKVHFTGAPYTGNLDHTDQPDKYACVLVPCVGCADWCSWACCVTGLFVIASFCSFVVGFLLVLL